MPNTHCSSRPTVHLLNKILLYHNTSSLPKCRICHERHVLQSCCVFHDMSVAERREAVKEKGYCFNCLCSSHTRNWCPSRKKCMVCNNNHHTMLHVDNHKNQLNVYSKSQRGNPSTSCQTDRRRQRSNQQMPSSSTTRGTDTRSRQNFRNASPQPERRPQPSQRPGKASTCSTTKHGRPQSYVSERLSGRSRMHVFLPTALARVLTPRGPEKTRLVLNSGAAQTVLLKGLVERLKLQTTKTDNKEYCTINLQSYNDPSAKVQIIGVVRSQLNTALPEATTEKKLMNIYNHLADLADPHFFQPSNIEVMIANDQLPRILRAGLIQTSSTMPIAQSTVFGWTISGACQY